MTLISQSLFTHLEDPGHHSVMQWRPKKHCLIIYIGNKLYISFGLKKLAGEMWL